MNDKAAGPIESELTDEATGRLWRVSTKHAGAIDIVRCCTADREEARVFYHRYKPGTLANPDGRILEVIEDAGTENFADDQITETK